MEPLIGTILMWGVPWVPAGWLLCQGQLLPVSEYQVLFSLIGTTYGGDGRTNFALPNLQGLVPVGTGQGQGSFFRLGIKGGVQVQNVVLTTDNLPAHTHPLTDSTANIPATSVEMSMIASTDDGERNIPQENDFLGAPEYTNRAVPLYRSDATNSVHLSGLAGNVPAQQVNVSGNVGSTGSGNPVQLNNMQPFMAVNFIIAYDGIYPQRP